MSKTGIRTPFPKKGDQVERVDFKRMFGRIKSIKGNKVHVCWNDDEKPKCTMESGNKLALVRKK